MSKYLIIDGMVSGTGIRDEMESNYLEPESLGLSLNLVRKIKNWHESYKNEFYKGYENKAVIKKLDEEGIEISKAVLEEIKNCKVNYFSDAYLKKTSVN